MSTHTNSPERTAFSERGVKPFAIGIVPTQHKPIKKQKISLSSHVLYGSSRLGVKQYMPGQFYAQWDYTQALPVIDTAFLTQRVPWYSLAQNDFIQPDKESPVGNVDTTVYAMQHQRGITQYELTNHLGNVQATVTDNRVPNWVSNDSVDYYKPAVAAAYDYYPYGMLMPGRYVQDTSAKCMTVSANKWMPYFTGPCYGYAEWPWPGLSSYSSVFTQIYGTDIIMTVLNGYIQFTLDVTPGKYYRLSYDITQLYQGQGTVTVMDYDGVNQTVMTGDNFSAPGRHELFFTPSENQIVVRFEGEFDIDMHEICLQYEDFGLHSVLVDVCNDMGDRYPYGFNGKEKGNELKGIGNSYDFGARIYGSRESRWMSLDPLAAKYPGISPYVFVANSPIFYNDLDGREPIPWYRRWYGEPRKAWQWYSVAGVYDSKTFNEAAIYNTNHLRASSYQSVYQRNAYYGWAQSQVDAKGYNSKWFGAAQLVTGLRGVGGTEILDGGLFSSSAVDKFLQRGNKFLFSHNMKNAKDFLADGKLSGGFTDAHGVKQSFEGLTGMALDYKMVEFEQSKVQEYINSYKGNDLDGIISEINDLMSSSLSSGEVKDVMKEHFDGGKSFNFKSYDDRVKLGQELINKAHHE